MRYRVANINDLEGLAKLHVESEETIVNQQIEEIRLETMKHDVEEVKAQLKEEERLQETVVTEETEEVKADAKKAEEEEAKKAEEEEDYDK